MGYPSERHRLWGDKAAQVATEVFGLQMGAQAWNLRAPQTIPAPTVMLTDAIADVFAAFEDDLRGRRAMQRVNLKLQIIATLEDAETGKEVPHEETPFHVNLKTGYNGMKYRDGLYAQKSLSDAIRAHEDRMFELGFKKADEIDSAQKAKA